MQRRNSRYPLFPKRRVFRAVLELKSRRFSQWFGIAVAPSPEPLRLNCLICRRIGNIRPFGELPMSCDSGDAIKTRYTIL